MTARAKITGVLSIFLAGTAAMAQPPEAGNHVFMREIAGKGGQTFSYISSEFSFDGRVVKNAPYSAEAVTETTQKLADGNRISQKSTATMYRDSEGRTRREETLGAIGPWASNSEPVRTVFINDPVSKTHLVLDSRTKTARKMPSPEIRTLPANGAAMADARAKKDIFFDTAVAPGAPAGIAIQGDMVKHVMVNGDVGGIAQASTGAMHSVTMALPGPGNPENTKTESLGSQMIDGVRADGTRTTMTIPAGSIGNDLPIEIVSERWLADGFQRPCGLGFWLPSPPKVQILFALLFAKRNY